MESHIQQADNRTQQVVALVLRVLAIGMAGVSIALALIDGAETQLYGVVLGIGLFCLAVAAILDTSG